MNAIFKDNDKIIINGADSSEKILLEELCNMVEAGKSVKITKLYDVNGDVSGIAIQVVDEE